jgi:O-antigen/teichoic acid export membrane protein
LLKASIASIGMKLIGAFAWMLLNIVFAALISVNDFGLFSFAMSTIAVLGTLACYGYGQVIMRDGSQVRELAKDTLFREILSTGRAAVLLVSFFVTLVLFAGYALNVPVPVFSHGPAFLGVVAACTPLYGFMLLHREGLRADGQLGMALIGFNLLRPIVPLVVFGTMLLFVKPDIMTAMIAWLLGLLVIFVIDSARLHPTAWAILPIAKPGVASMRKASVLCLSEVSNIVLLQAPILVAGIVVDLGAAALLYAAHRLAMLALFGIDGMRIALAPQIARSFTRSSREEQASVLNRASVLWAVSGLIFAAPIGILAPQLLGLFGHEYVEATTALLIITIGRLFQALVGPTGAVMQYGRMEHLRAAFTLAAAAVQIAATVCFGKIFGIVGIAWAMTLSIIALEIVSLLAIRRRTGIWLGVGFVIQKPSSIPAAFKQLLDLLRKRRP